MHVIEELPPELQTHLYSLEEEMGRQQYKNIFDNVKSHMAIPKTSGSTTAKLDHPNSDETE